MVHFQVTPFHSCVTFAQWAQALCGWSLALLFLPVARWGLSHHGCMQPNPTAMPVHVCESPSHWEFVDWVSEKHLYSVHRGLQLVSQVQCASLGTPRPYPPSFCPPAAPPQPSSSARLVCEDPGFSHFYSLPSSQTLQLSSPPSPPIHPIRPSWIPQLHHAPVHSRDEWFCPLQKAENCSFLELNSHRD